MKSHLQNAIELYAKNTEDFQNSINDFKPIERIDLLILDNFSMQAFASQAREILMDIIEDRYQKRSYYYYLSGTTQRVVCCYLEKTVANAVLDRLVHHSLRVELYGESIRKRKSRDENNYR